MSSLRYPPLRFMTTRRRGCLRSQANPSPGYFFSLCRRRGNGTAATTGKVDISPLPPPLPPAAQPNPNGDGRGRVRPPRRRPDISYDQPRKWNRPLAEGVLPAYDLALKLIRTDSIRLKQETEEARKQVQVLEAKVDALRLELRSASASGEIVGKEGETESENVGMDLRVEAVVVERARKALRKLQVESMVNLPEERWRVANAMEDMTKPVHRHLVEQRWRKGGDLDLLMERIHQMKVIPDILPNLHPSIDLHVSARTTYKDMKSSGKKHFTVESGTFLLPEQTLEPPNIYATVFHTDTRLYTLLLVDLDVPNEETRSFSTYLHWLKPNIPLSAITHREKIKDLNDHTPYIPPHPQRGTKYHRYVLLMIPQPPLDVYAASPWAGVPRYRYHYPLTTEARAAKGEVTSVRLDDIPPVDAAGRRDFDVRAFVQRWGLDGERAGAHMWREVWGPAVSKIYRNILKEPEPRYGLPQKPDRYAELREIKKYV